MLSLPDRLRARIQSEGPITFHDFMATALYDDEAGYYCHARHRWGREGDYRTSPERSVLFAATFANYFSRLFEKLGRPASWVVLEAGAGSGEFAEGVLDTLLVRAPEVFKATRYVIDERSPSSQAVAAERLARFGSKVEFAKLSDLKSIPVGIIFSNELLDAFPVHRVKLADGELVEFFVKVNAAGQFAWSIQEPSTPKLQSYFAGAGICLAEEQIAEVNLEARNWIRSAVELLERGYVISVDYGAEAEGLFSATDRPHGTLRSFHNHQLVNDVLGNPGEQDMTSSVNWSDVINAGESAGLKTIVFERQDQFLMREGLLEELELRVSEAAGEAEKLRLRTSAREMILPGGMAADFQVLVQEKS
ncbi:MAG TPA: SAM-dependent methyltransferase [Pyrinomonadaceae bacterium]|nr:SAM-dependent methyltransferase [Pyrinomonadaceae bacterium]